MVRTETAVRRLVLLLPVTCLMIGCFHPGMYYGNPYGRPYGQPMYAPPQTINPGAPGSLYIPESNEPPYAPGGGGTYDADPDDFQKSDGDDDVPFPNDRRTPFYGDEGDDFGGPSTKLDGDSGNMTARPVSLTLDTNAIVAGETNPATDTETRVPLEYGFDTAEYTWLRGQLRFSSEANAWQIVYSVAARDRYRGVLTLDVSADQLSGLNDGDPVDVRGYPADQMRDESGKPVYKVEEIRLMATRFAG